MRTCYLHVGTHKTGSSVLQKMMFDNVENLAAAGIFVPEMNAVKAGGNHHRLAAEFNFDKLASYRHALTAELRQAGFPQVILVSSENLSARLFEPAVRDRMAQYFGELGYSVQLIAYIRPQLDLVNSVFTEKVKKLVRRMSFDDFLAEFIATPTSDFNLKFEGLIQDDRFRCQFIPFNKPLLHHGICETFLSLLSLPPEAIAACRIPATRNESPGPRTIAALQEVGRTIDRDNIQVRPDRLKKVASSLRRMADSLGWNASRYYGATPAQRSLLIEKFSHANDVFSQSVWKRPWSEVFGEDEMQALNRETVIFDPASASSDERDEFNDFCAFALRLLTEEVGARSGGIGKAAE